MSAIVSVNECKSGRWIRTNLPHSRMTLDCPIRTAIRFPNADTAMRKLRALEAPLLPKTFSKNKLAVVNFEAKICAFVDAAKYAMFTKMYRIVVPSKAKGALNLSVFVGFWTSVSVSIQGFQTRKHTLTSFTTLNAFS